MSHSDLLEKIARKEARVGVIGLGYVGLPLAVAAARSGFATLGLDHDAERIIRLQSGSSYIGAVADCELQEALASKSFRPVTGFEALPSCDIVIVCVPTPLTAGREPDLSFVIAATKEVAKRLRPGQLYVLESTTYPGTTRGPVKTILSASGLAFDEDFFVGYSPEREDPGNSAFKTRTIPKVVSGDGARSTELVRAFYAQVVEKIVTVSSPELAEAAKLTENIFRAVNIALVNELKMIFTRMDIDIWEVIEAAASKPFGYMPFYPGPGLGGHCVPIDPFYLSWIARKFGAAAQFVELAGEINTHMPYYVVDCLASALDERLHIALARAKVLLVGISYKKNIEDIRESPSLVLIDILEGRGAAVDFHDPLLPIIPITREYPRLAGRSSVPLTKDLAQYDAVLIATDHDVIDYVSIAERARVIIDTRNALASRGLTPPTLVKA